jgi:hypothetical protein
VESSATKSKPRASQKGVKRVSKVRGAEIRVACAEGDSGRSWTWSKPPSKGKRSWGSGRAAEEEPPEEKEVGS